MLSHAQLFVTLWTLARQAPLFMGFSRQEYWGGLPFPSPRDLPNPGIKPRTPALQANSLLTELQGKPEFGLTQLSQAHSSNLDQMIHVILGHLMLSSQSNPSSGPPYIAQPMASFPSYEFPTALVPHHRGRRRMCAQIGSLQAFHPHAYAGVDLIHRPIPQTVKLRS